MRGLSWIAATLLLVGACAGTPSEGIRPVRPRAEARPIGGTSDVSSTGGGEHGEPAGRVFAYAGDGRGSESDSPGGPRTDLGDAIESVAPPWGSDESKSWLIPAAEIVAFEFLLNQYDGHCVNAEGYGTDADRIRDNLHTGWDIDKAPFSMNQFGHPYAGSVYHGFARSAGLSYWESLPYDIGASALWEIAGETDPPSRNDLITTSFAGSFLGEALYRTANYVLEGGGKDPSVG